MKCLSYIQEARCLKVNSLKHDTNAIEQSLSSEALTSAAGHIILHFLRNVKVHNCVYSSLSAVHILTHIKPVHTLPSHFFNVHFNNFSNLHLGLPNSLFPAGFTTKTLLSFRFFPHILHVTCPAHFTLLDFSVLKISGDQYLYCKIIKLYSHTKFSIH